MLIDSSYCFKTRAFPRGEAQTIEPLLIRLGYGEIYTIPNLAGQKWGRERECSGCRDVPTRSSSDSVSRHCRDSVERQGRVAGGG